MFDMCSHLGVFLEGVLRLLDLSMDPDTAGPGDIRLGPRPLGNSMLPDPDMRRIRSIRSP